ncbi:MAG: helix-turn-helix transcriptional regulator [Clostridia bacterium]|nr:helix-turn-helix transcriptional regulator [Clostridia bacterium]
MSHADIGTRIRALRYEAGLTLESVSGELGISVQMMSQIERGVNQLSLLNADKLAKLYGCTIEDILKEEPHERKTGNA